MRIGYLIFDQTLEKTLTPTYEWAKLGEPDSYYVFEDKEVEVIQHISYRLFPKPVYKREAKYNFNLGVQVLGNPEVL